MCLFRANCCSTMTCCVVFFVLLTLWRFILQRAVVLGLYILLCRCGSKSNAPFLAARLTALSWWHCSDEASMFKRLAAMIGKLPTESNHKRRSRRGCIVFMLCVGVWTICVCVFLTLMYLRLSFTWSLRLGNQRSVFVWLFHVFLLMEEFIVWRTHRRLALHEMTLRISRSHGAFLCEAGFLLSAPVSYFIGSIFMSIDTRIFPICILFPSSFLQSSCLKV